jgi:hypothetical protein
VEIVPASPAPDDGPELDLLGINRRVRGIYGEATSS